MSLTKEFVYQWYNAPQILKHQIELLSDHFRGSRRIQKEHKNLREKYYDVKFPDGKSYKGEELNKIFLYVSIFKHISALDVARERFLKDLPCYNERGEPIIQLEKRMSEGSHVKLFSARFICPENYPEWGNKTVIAKLYESGHSNRNTSYEINIYRILGSPSPSIDINCYLWNIPVLIMKPMRPLEPSDDEIEVGIQILKQLPALHQFAVHSDIKPDNIMREKGMRPRVYKLIDFGGCACEPYNDGRKTGFKRRTWSAKWTTQKRKGVVTNPKYDLLELGHTLTALKHVRKTGKSHYPGKKRRTFTGRLEKYMDYVKDIDDGKLKHNEYGPHYLKLIQILSGSRESSQVDKRDKVSSRNVDSRNPDSRKLDNRKRDHTKDEKKDNRDRRGRHSINHNKHACNPQKSDSRGKFQPRILALRET